ncbi:hypothetical protein Gogos_022163, partial [Gossypium gossypioides]|nr:hypothetical protein [Gossypium gossypioides]
MAASRFDIEQFDGIANFNLWQVQMMTILVQNGLNKVVIGKKPIDMDHSEWEELNEKALSTIQLCVINNTLQEVLNEKIMSTLCKKLEALYMKKSLTNRLVLKQRLYTFRMVEGESIRTHVSEFVTLLNDLKNLEAEISDGNQVMLLLCSLPSFYKTFMETLIYERDNLLFEDVKGNLLSKDKLDNESKARSKSRNRDKYCGYCKKKAKVADASIVNDKGDDFLLVSTRKSSHLTFNWILDSRCNTPYSRPLP